MGAGGDRKVTPGVTGSSRARAPIDPAVWYLGPFRGPWGRIVVTRLKYPQKIRVSAYNGETLTPFSRSAFAHKGEEREKGNAVGSLTGLCTPIAREVVSEQDKKDSEQNLHKVFSRVQGRLKALEEEEGGDADKYHVEDVVLRSQARHLRAEDQQQHSSNRQFGQSRGDLEALHSS